MSINFIEAMREALTTMSDEILSPIYIGWVQGYLDEERKKFEQFLAEGFSQNVIIRHPRNSYREFVADLAHHENSYWLA